MEKKPSSDALHLRLPKALRGRLLRCRDKLRKQDPMVNLSDVARVLLDEALTARQL